MRILRPLQVLGLLHFLLGGDHVTVAPAVLPAQHLETQLLVLRCQCFADLAVQHLVRMVIVAPHEGQVEHAHPLVEIVVDRSTADMHCGAGTELHALDHCALLAQLVGRVHARFQRIGVAVDVIGDDPRRHVVVVGHIRCRSVRNLDLLLGLRSGIGCHGNHRRKRQSHHRVLQQRLDVH